MLFFKLSANRYDLGLSNEPLFIIIAQGAAKLWPIKVGDLKKIQDSTPDHTRVACAPEFFSDFQLWQVTVLQPLELWWWKVAHLRAPSHIYWHLTLKKHSFAFIICQDILKSDNLLHKQGFVDSQMKTIVTISTSRSVCPSVHSFVCMYES